MLLIKEVPFLRKKNGIKLFILFQTMMSSI